MGMFGSKVEKAQMEEWRGRSRDLPDAGALSWKVVWEALLVEPGAAPGGAMDPIGLRGVVVPHKGGSDATAVYQGTRHGQVVHIRTGSLGGRGGIVSSIWLGVTTPNFSSMGSGGYLQTRGITGEVMDHFCGFVAAPDVWVGSQLYGGPRGIAASRVVDKAHPQAWIYDLWLCERVADLCGISVLDEPAYDYWDLPYGVPSAEW